MTHRRVSSRGRVIRILAIYHRLCLGRAFTASSLSRELSVTDRTIKRDLELLRDVPLVIAYDRQKRTYFLENRPGNGGPFKAPHEVMALLLGIMVLEELPCGIEKALLESLRMRLLALLPGRSAIRSVSAAGKSWSG
jgi:predicted DNA-binding transcriptional regulator YafY